MKFKAGEYETELHQAADAFAGRVIPKYDAACDRALSVLVREAYASGFKHGHRMGKREGIEFGKKLPGATR